MTDRNRNTIRRAIGGVLFNVSNFPEQARPYLAGQNMGPLNEKITDAVLAALPAHTPTDDEREALAQWLHMRFAWPHSPSERTPWLDLPEHLKAGWRDLAEDAPSGFRRSEVPGGEEWQVAIEAERERQIAKGYTAEHDARHGIRHLLSWAMDYDRRGKTLEASALKRAALDLLPSEPQGDPCSEVPSWDTRVQKLREAVAAQTGSYLSIEGAEAILETVSPKRWGDPSDAEADEAQRGYHAFAFGPDEVDVFLTPERLAKGRDAWKAALRAAGGVR